MTDVCMAHGPDCKNVLHVRVSRDDWQRRIDRRRMQVLPVPQEWLLDALNNRIDSAQAFIKLLVALPEDARIDHVGYDYRSDSIIAYVWSKTFEPVEEGVELPTIPTLALRVPAAPKPEDYVRVTEGETP